MAARDKGVDWQTAKHNSYISKFVEAEDGKYSYVERIQDYKFCSDESDGHRKQKYLCPFLVSFCSSQQTWSLTRHKSNMATAISLFCKPLSIHWRRTAPKRKSIQVSFKVSIHIAHKVELFFCMCSSILWWWYTIVTVHVRWYKTSADYVLLMYTCRHW